MFSLVFTRDGQVIRHTLSAGDTVVGRTTVCDLVIDDPSISRRHARFRVHGEHCVIADLGGRNGTFLNDQPITEAEVADGDTVVLGRFSLQIARGPYSPVILSEQHSVDMNAATALAIPADSLVAGPIAPALDSAQMVRLLRATADALVGWYPQSELLERIVKLVFELIAAERAFLLITHEGDGALLPAVARLRSGEAMGNTSLNRAVVERVRRERVAIAAGDARPQTPSTDARTATAIVRPFLCAPLALPDRVLGVVYVDNPLAHALPPEDLEVLRIVGHYAALAVERTRLARTITSHTDDGIDRVG